MRIVGIGGTLRAGSSTERAVRTALAEAERLGAEVVALSGAELDLPTYAPERPERSGAARALVEQLRAADGIVVGSPGYHGGISGLVKNALDYTEDLRDDERPYFDGRAVGCIASAAGWQAGSTTLAALRSVVHALRGWPTPFGVTINSRTPVFDPAGTCVDPEVATRLALVGRQVVEFAQGRAAIPVPAGVARSGS